MKPLENLVSNLRVGDLPSPKPHRDLHLVVVSEETLHALPFHLEVARSDLWTELHLFDDGAGLVLPRLASLDGLVVLVLSVVHHPDNRGAGVRGNLDEIKLELIGQPSCLFDRLDADLPTVRVYEAYLLDPDLLIDSRLLDRMTSRFSVVRPSGRPAMTKRQHARVLPDVSTRRTSTRWTGGKQAPPLVGSAESLEGVAW